MAQTIERQATAVPTRGGRWPIIALAVMVVAALGAGTWWFVDEYTGVDRQIEVLIDDYRQAWVDGDGQALLAVMTPAESPWREGRHVSDGTGAGGYGGEQLATFVENIDTSFDFTMESLGDPVIIGGPNQYLVTQPAEGGLIGEGFNFFRIVEYQGELLISYHTWLD
jgi:hypothetical protein